MIEPKKITIYILLLFIGIILYIIINNNNIETLKIYNCGCDDLSETDHSDSNCEYVIFDKDTQVQYLNRPISIFHYLFEL